MRPKNGLTGGVVGGVVQVGSAHGDVTFHAGPSRPAPAEPVELLFTAVERLYSPWPLMRFAAVVALEQLACEHTRMRRAVRDVLTLHLDLPREPTAAEQRVGVAARAVLGRVERLAAPPGRT